MRYVHTRGSHVASDSFSFVVTVPSNPSSTQTNNVVAYTEDTFKIDIISNIIRVNDLKEIFTDFKTFKILGPEAKCHQSDQRQRNGDH